MGNYLDFHKKHLGDFGHQGFEKVKKFRTQEVGCVRL